MAIAIAGKKTKYKGVEFRSQLEARWAEFFDNERVPWQYEPRTYSIAHDGKKGRITPDFRLMYRWVVEIKPVSELFFDNKRLMQRYYEWQLSYAEPLLIVWGTPHQFESVEFRYQVASFAKWRESFRYVHLLSMMQTYRDAVRMFALDREQRS